MSEQYCTYLTRGKAGCQLAVQLQAIAIVVDALRASTTIALLFDHGIERIQVVAQVEDALALSHSMPGAFLVGERGGERLPGFHFGNSPKEILASPRMDGRTAIFTSSNGAQRLTACAGASEVLVSTVSNAGAVVNYLRNLANHLKKPVVFIAAGQFPDEEFISPEDDVSCVYLAAQLGLPIAPSSQQCYAQWERSLSLEGLDAIFHHSRHAKRLMEIGYEEDIAFCARPDTAQVVPVVTAPVYLADRQVGVEIREELARIIHDEAECRAY